MGTCLDKEETIVEIEESEEIGEQKIEELK